MVRNYKAYLLELMTIILLMASMPVQADTTQGPGSPLVISSNISDKIIAYKGVENPGYTTIRFNTNEPVEAYLSVSGNAGSTEIKLSDRLAMKSEFEVFFVPMDYEKAHTYISEALPPGTYNVSVTMVDEFYKKSIIRIGTIKIVKEEKEQPLVEILDIEMTNEVKNKQIEPKIKLKYKVNRPAYIEAPIFHDYRNDYLTGESARVISLPIDHYIKTPGTYELEWNLKLPEGIYIDERGAITQYTQDTVLPPDTYKLFFKSLEDSVRRGFYNYSFKLNNSEEIDFMIALNNNNTTIELLNGWSPKKELGESADEDLSNVLYKDILNHWSKDCILFLSSRGIISGVGNNKFNPDKSITRAEYIAMVVRVLNVEINPEGETSFIDVQSNDWYHDVVEIAYELGLITGYVDQSFKPNQSITRQEMTVIAENALMYKLGEQSLVNDDMIEVLSIYDDNKQIGSWARASVAVASSYNLVRGKGNNLFDPFGISTRAEGATIVKRLYEYENEK